MDIDGCLYALYKPPNFDRHLILRRHGRVRLWRRMGRGLAGSIAAEARRWPGSPGKGWILLGKFG